MPDVVFPLDPARRFTDQELIGHSRWHPEIPPVAMVRCGDVFRVHCRDWFDGAIGNNDSAQDILHAPFHMGHKLSGPFAVESARPGDLLVVDIADIGPTTQDEIGPLPGQGWGYTGIFAPRNGGGFLGEHFPDAYKAIWEFAGGRATSRHIPGVAFDGAAHPGLMGTAPSAALLAKWNTREAKLVATNPFRVPPLALPPLAKGALLGHTADDDVARIAVEAAQTAPPRENGGNQDIKNLTKGSRIFYPVFVDGANLSVGDLHFSQGDGEITFCGAIEIGGYIDLQVDLIRGGMDTYKVYENPLFLPGGSAPEYEDWISFSGTSVTLDGRQKYLDPYLAYQRACLNAIDYLTTFGVLTRTGLSSARSSSGRRAPVQCRRHSQCVRHHLCPDRDFRLRHHSERLRSPPRHVDGAGTPRRRDPASDGQHPPRGSEEEARAASDGPAVGRSRCAPIASGREEKDPIGSFRLEVVRISYAHCRVVVPRGEESSGELPYYSSGSDNPAHRSR